MHRNLKAFLKFAVLHTFVYSLLIRYLLNENVPYNIKLKSIDLNIFTISEYITCFAIQWFHQM